MNSLQQQAKFDEFLREFNEERPHEALDMKRPAEVYARLNRVPMTACPISPIPCTTATSSSLPAVASACIANASTSRPSSPANVSESRKSTKAFGSSASCSYDLGFIDLEQKTLQPLDNPFGPRLSPMS